MQGYSHALTGAAGWLAVTSAGSIADLGWFEQPGEVALAGTVLCAGAALLPDVDHPQGTIAWSLPSVTVGPVTIVRSPTRVLCDVVESISGGHRHATHSFLGIAVFTVLAWLASLWTMTIGGRTVAVGATIFAALLIAFATKPLGLHHAFAGSRGSVSSDVMRSWLGPWVLAVGGAGAAAWFLDYQWTWLPVAVALGVFLHLVGDSMTTGKVPWLWPWHPKPPRAAGSWMRWAWSDNGYMGLPVLGRTDSWRERVFGVLLGAYVCYLGVHVAAGLNGTHVLP